jgi:hypothetical protein
VDVQSDLRSDLRAGKMRRYQPQATECWLAVADGVVSRKSGPGRDSDWLAMLEAEGLLPGWGALYVPTNGVPWILRRPSAHEGALVATEDRVRDLWTASARSLAYKAATRQPWDVTDEAVPAKHPDDWFPAGVE